MKPGREQFRPFWRDHPYLTAVALVLAFPAMLVIGALRGLHEALQDWAYEWDANWRTR